MAGGSTGGSEEATPRMTTHESVRMASSLQAILHRQNAESGEQAMETMEVPLPLPDAVIRPSHASGHDELFRRVRSSDSVVRYYEHPEGIAVGAAADVPRTCTACRHHADAYFVRTLPVGTMVTADTAALCAPCYGRAAGLTRGRE